MLIPARPYTKSDATRVELNVQSVLKMMDKYHLTTQDILTGLRLGQRKHKWDEALDNCRESCILYERYKGVDSEETLKTYGEDE